MIFGDLSEKFKTAGVNPKLEVWFYPFLGAPFFLLGLGLLWFLVSCLIVLRLPHIYLWYRFRQRRKYMLQELPFFLESLEWLIEIYPVPDAIKKAGSGALDPVCKDFWNDYSFGTSFEGALHHFRIFSELDEVADALLQLYKTGTGYSILGQLADKFKTQNTEYFRGRTARLQVFTTSYVLVSTALPAMGSSMSIAFGNPERTLILAGLLSLAMVVIWKLTD